MQFTTSVGTIWEVAMSSFSAELNWYQWSVSDYLVELLPAADCWLWILHIKLIGCWSHSISQIIFQCEGYWRNVKPPCCLLIGNTPVPVSCSPVLHLGSFNTLESLKSTVSAICDLVAFQSDFKFSLEQWLRILLTHIMFNVLKKWCDVTEVSGEGSWGSAEAAAAWATYTHVDPMKPLSYQVPFHPYPTSSCVCVIVVRLSKDCLLSWALLGAVRTKFCCGEEKQSTFCISFQHGEHSYCRAEWSDIHFRSTIMQYIFICPSWFQTLPQLWFEYPEKVSGVS